MSDDSDWTSLRKKLWSDGAQNFYHIYNTDYNYIFKILRIEKWTQEYEHG